MKFVGKTDSIDDPLKTFEIQEVVKGNWRWILDNETNFKENEVQGGATMNFENGWLKCYIFEGDIVMRKNHKIVVRYKDIEREVLGMLGENILILKGNLQLRLDFETNTIEEQKML